MEKDENGMRKCCWNCMYYDPHMRVCVENNEKNRTIMLGYASYNYEEEIMVCDKFNSLNNKLND